jgi:hypothetical protein
VRLNDVCSPSPCRERKTLVLYARDMDVGKRPLLVKYVILGPPPLENQKKKFSENKLIKAKKWYSGVKNGPNVMCQIWVHPKAEGIDDLIWNVNKESSLILPMQWSPPFYTNFNSILCSTKYLFIGTHLLIWFMDNCSMDQTFTFVIPEEIYSLIHCIFPLNLIASLVLPIKASQ